MRQAIVMGVVLAGLAGCGGDGPATGPDADERPVWVKGDRAILLPKFFDEDRQEWKSIFAAKHRGTDLWRIAEGTEVVVLGLVDDGEKADVIVPGDAITTLGRGEATNPSETIRVDEFYLNPIR